MHGMQSAGRTSEANEAAKLPSTPAEQGRQAAGCSCPQSFPKLRPSRVPTMGVARSHDGANSPPLSMIEISVNQDWLCRAKIAKAKIIGPSTEKSDELGNASGSTCALWPPARAPPSGDTAGQFAIAKNSGPDEWDHEASDQPEREPEKRPLPQSGAIPDNSRATGHDLMHPPAVNAAPRTGQLKSAAGESRRARPGGVLGRWDLAR